MIDLYAAGTSNGMRARIALEECGLPYTFHPINLEKGDQKTREFLALNPMGQIPVIVDHDGPGGKPVTVSQSTAILMYCAEKSGKHLPKSPVSRPAFLEALMRASTDMTPTIGAVFNSSRMKEPHGPTVEMFKDNWRRYLKVWDDLLGRQKYAAGDDFTIADLSLYAGYARAKMAMPDLCAGCLNVARWAKELDARPAIQRAMKF